MSSTTGKNRTRINYFVNQCILNKYYLSQKAASQCSSTQSNDICRQKEERREGSTSITANAKNYYNRMMCPCKYARQVKNAYMKVETPAGCLLNHLLPLSGILHLPLLR